MSRTEHTSISDLTGGTFNGKILVRISRLWESHPKDSKVITALNMTVFDEKKVKIHAAIHKRELIARHQADLVEGKCYVFHKFFVVENKDSFRSTSHDFRIVFHFATQVRQVDAPIPRYCFNFVEFFLISIEDKPDQSLVDVIGAMTTCGDIRSYQYYGIAGQILDFTLQNEDGDNLKCSIFGPLEKEIYEYVINHEGPIITIIELGRMKKFRDEMQINSSWNATKVLLNLDIDEVKNFRTRPDVKLYPSTSSTTQLNGSVTTLIESLGAEQTKTINEILDIDQGGKYIVTATISAINVNSNWFYESCNSCRKKTEVQDNIPFCRHCNKQPGALIARYMTHITVEDGTGDAVFVFFDDIGFKLLKRTAYDLRKQQAAAGEKYGFPKELDELVGKNLKFCIEVSEFYNLTKKSKTYTVLEASETNTIVDHANVNSNSPQSVKCSEKPNCEITTATENSVELSSFVSPMLGQIVDTPHLTQTVQPMISTAISLKKDKRKVYTNEIVDVEDVQVDLSEALDSVVVPANLSDAEPDTFIHTLKSSKKNKKRSSDDENISSLVKGKLTKKEKLSKRKK